MYSVLLLKVMLLVLFKSASSKKEDIFLCFQVATSLNLWKPIIQLCFWCDRQKFLFFTKWISNSTRYPTVFFSFPFKCFQFFLYSSFIFYLFPSIESRLSHCTSPKVNFHSASQHHFEINTNSNKYEIHICRYIRLASLKMKKTKTDK